MNGQVFNNPPLEIPMGGGRLAVRLGQDLNPTEVEAIRVRFEKVFQQNIKSESSVVSPTVGREIVRNTLKALLFASLAIIIYIAFRFEYRFSIATILSLFYNALFTTGVFSWFGIEVDLLFVVAILTVIGYDMNDSIVIFDRIRENLDRNPPRTRSDLFHLVNSSIHQTLVRSINTVLTVLFAGVSLYIFAGESIGNFALALLIGITTGTFTSIFLASQVWVGWKWHSMKKAQIATNEVKS